MDRLLVLLSGFRYRHAVTLKRTRLALTVFWVTSIIGAVVPSLPYGMATQLYWYVWSPQSSATQEYLHNHQIQVGLNISQTKLSQTTSMNRARYRKTVFAAMWVQLAYSGLLSPVCNSRSVNL